MNGNDETTQNLTDRQLLLLLLERVINIDERVARLEKAEADRQLETRPLWERLEGQMTQLFAKITAIEDQLERMRIEISLLREDLYNEKIERGYLAKRVTELEKQRQVA